MNGKFCILLGCMLLGACAVGEDYEKPKLAVTDQWMALKPDKHDALTSEENKDLPAKVLVLQTDQPDKFSSTRWWEHFNDPILNQLLEKAKLANNDLKTAELHIAEARGNERSTTSVLFPQVSANGSYTHSGDNGTAQGPADTVKQGGVSATWDIDLFGGDRRNIEAAWAEIQATEHDRDKVMLAVAVNVATNYIQLRSLQQQRLLTLQNLETQKDTLKITLGQRAEGAVSDLEVARARAEVSGTAARLPQIHTATVAALNRLSVLTGEAPHSLSDDITKPEQIPTVPEEVIVGTPIAAMEHRPDIQASERRLAEATALSGAAFAQLFPKITLQSFFEAEWSRYYGFSAPFNASAGVLMPLLEWGRIRGLIDATDARQQEAFFTYQQTVLLSLEEIENALTAYMDEQRRKDMLLETSRAQIKATEVAREQYKVGAATQLDLLIAENNQLDTENDLTLSSAALATDLIQLYAALGESWPHENTDNTVKSDTSPAPSAEQTVPVPPSTP